MKKFFLLCACIFAAFTASAQGFANETVNGGHKTTKGYSSGPIKFQAYANVGTIFTGPIAHTSYAYMDITGSGGGPTVDVSAGIMIHDRLYVGGEIGVHTLLGSNTFTYSDRWENYEETIEYTGVYIPMGVNLKGYITKDKTINPFINCSLGGFVGTADFDYLSGLFCQVGAGIEWKRFSFGIGYNCLYDMSAIHAGYIKLGVRIGK